jgi:sec-independent protein translocase protein TatC
MSTATATEPPKPKAADAKPAEAETMFDPDSFRMTVGEHLEELRGRLILAIGGLFVSILGCLLFSERVMVFFCAPLNSQLRNHGLPEQMYYASLTDPFMTYLKVTMITASAIAGPWMIYQAWKFVAAGLYPNERKMITRYIPLSMTLFISGLVFVYVLVLPLSIKFFIEFSAALTPRTFVNTTQVDAPTPYVLPLISGDPKVAPWGAMWYDPVRKVLKLAIPGPDNNPNNFRVRTIPLGPESMMVPIITIGEYIDLVLTFEVTFGIAFQLPLVMLALVSVGIVDVAFLKKNRRVMFFGMAVAAAFLAPGDIVTSMLALLVPLIVLYEFGLLLVKFAEARKVREAARESSTNG